MINAVQPRLPWHVATTSAIRPEAPGVATIAFDVPGWPGHLAGQHVDIRLTAPDGYQAQRSYSISSAPGAATVDMTVEHVPDGEVSSFLLAERAVGDRIELRGPIGGYFTWEPGEDGPVLLVAGGSGMAPLMAMLRLRRQAADRTPTRLLYSSRSYDSIIYREELDDIAAEDEGFAVTYTLTRAQPPGWTGERRRIDRPMLERVGFDTMRDPRAFVCGPTPLVEGAAAHLVALGYREARVKTERFGPTGDAR
ncbi:MAG: Flavodoxin reductases (ferredoxin-NADPH reductases) family 1 [uncultured Sphingomonadaceae bacterium]|uniref:Flavodoxin reductases (Ferredoxin-NADPH reductases) family 1 n=1 Tax=uncultured Sphingomonadaceae bacterium TaxID=169976 RepID=A0A6J4U1A0_9SPHN|nr:MAG: Flavodoxin reductases (ferredoxin-NADPH reductases) family 1 [uncultured Sphingomonadaceae bacterium]